MSDPVAPVAPAEATEPQDAQVDNNSELNNALSDFFKANPVPEQPVQSKNEKPNSNQIPQESKKEPESQKAPQAIDQKKASVKPEEQKPLPTPETITAPERIHAKSKENWESLKDNYSRAHKLLSEREKEIEKLKLTFADSENLTKKEKEELKKQIEELNGYRQMVDVQADPQFNQQYETPIQTTVAQVKQLLVDGGANQDLVDQLTEEHILDQQNVKNWMDAFDKAGQTLSGKRLMNRVENLMDLTEKREGAIKDYKTKYKEYIENKKKESFSKGTEAEGKMIQRLEAVKAMKNSTGNPAFEYLIQKVPTVGASAAEVEQIQKHNRLAEVLENNIKGYMKVDAPQDRVDLAVTAAMLPIREAQLRIAEQRVAALEKEIKSITAITEEKPSTSVSRNGGSRSTSNMNLDDALQARFSR